MSSLIAHEVHWRHKSAETYRDVYLLSACTPQACISLSVRLGAWVLDSSHLWPELPRIHSAQAIPNGAATRSKRKWGVATRLTHPRKKRIRLFGQKINGRSISRRRTSVEMDALPKGEFNDCKIRSLIARLRTVLLKNPSNQSQKGSWRTWAPEPACA